MNNSPTSLRGSSKRKQYALFKSITMEEFLNATGNVCHHLTAIDKLLFRNKRSLAELRLKKPSFKVKEPKLCKRAVLAPKNTPKNTNKLDRKVVLKSKQPDNVTKTSRKTKKERAGKSNYKAREKSSKSAVPGKTLPENTRKLRKKPKAGSTVTKKLKGNTDERSLIKDHSLKVNTKKLLLSSIKKDTFEITPERVLRNLKRSAKDKPDLLPRKKIRSRKPRVQRKNLAAFKLSLPQREPSKDVTVSENVDEIRFELSFSLDEPLDEVVLPQKKTKLFAQYENTYEPQLKTNVVSNYVESENFNVKTVMYNDLLDDLPVPNGLRLQDFYNLRDYEVGDVEDDGEEVILFPDIEDVSDKEENEGCGLNEEKFPDTNEDAIDNDSEKILYLTEAACNGSGVMLDISDLIYNESLKCSEEESTKHYIFNILGLQSNDKIDKSPKKSDDNINDYSGTLRINIAVDEKCKTAAKKKESIDSFYTNAVSPPKSGNDQSSVNGSNDGLLTIIFADNANTEPTIISSRQVSLDDAIQKSKSVCNSSSTVDNVTNAVKISQPAVVSNNIPTISIHSDHVCAKVCKYCFANFGTLDTPCHVGQMKSQERRTKILSYEPLLKLDTCLCEACFKLIAKKANRKINNLAQFNHKKVVCVVRDCDQSATTLHGTRKWRLKICKKILDLKFNIKQKEENETLGLCPQHYCMLGLHKICGICKKRLEKNDIFSLRSQIKYLNQLLRQDGIPARLTHNMLLCRSCHHCIMLRLNFNDLSKMSDGNRYYYESFKEQIIRLQKLENSNGIRYEGEVKIIDLTTDDDIFTNNNHISHCWIGGDQSHNTSVCDGDSDELSKGNVSSAPIDEWERYMASIQFDEVGRNLWYDLCRAYADQSSFLRHLITLEKHWRSGSLVLANNVDTKAVKYITGAKNHLESVEEASSIHTTFPEKSSNVDSNSLPSKTSLELPRPKLNNLKSSFLVDKFPVYTVNSSSDPFSKSLNLKWCSYNKRLVKEPNSILRVQNLPQEDVPDQRKLPVMKTVSTTPACKTHSDSSIFFELPEEN